MFESVGLAASMEANSRGLSAASTMSVSAVTVAVRGVPTTSDSSPKKSPGPSRAMSCSSRLTVTVPSQMIMNSRPGAPCQPDVMHPLGDNGQHRYRVDH